MLEESERERESSEEERKKQKEKKFTPKANSKELFFFFFPSFFGGELENFWKNVRVLRIVMYENSSTVWCIVSYPLILYVLLRFYHSLLFQFAI